MAVDHELTDLHSRDVSLGVLLLDGPPRCASVYGL
jgi:hypothetical protein